MASKEQREQGVVEPQNKEAIEKLLTFEVLPTRQLLWERAEMLTAIAVNEGWECVLVGCAPFFVSELERALERKKIKAVYSFSPRKSEEKMMPDGTIKKVGYFVHQGFIDGRVEYSALPLGTLQ